MNKEIEKLIKIQQQAAKIADRRDRNEMAFEKAYEKARKSPEWKEYCRSKGICESYNYGDIIC